METLYDRIRNLRIEKNLSQDELAKMMGYTSRSTINKIESGLIDISIKKLLGFAKVLNTTPGYLLDGEFPEKKTTYSSAEEELIKKYRQLPQAGKAAVDTMLNVQYDLVKPKLLEDTETS